MKKILTLLLGLALIAGLFALPGCRGEDGKALNILTWENYIPQDVMKAFQEETGIKINLSNFDSNEEMLMKLEAAEAKDYDLVVASDYIIDIARKKGGLLKELDKSKLPNYQNLDPVYLSQYYDPDNLYTIPYAAGTPLIVYDPQKVSVPITGYEDLWNPALKDSIVAMDDARNIIGITLKSMGQSFNVTDDAILQQASDKLNRLKPNIRVLSYDNPQDALINKEASVGYLFTPQVVQTLQARPELKVVYPKEGMGFGIDCLFVPYNAPHEDNAYQFLNYILDAEVGARVSSQVLYLCPNQAAYPYLTEEYKNNQCLYIPAEILGETEFIQDVGEKTEVYDSIWTEFKQQ